MLTMSGKFDRANPHQDGIIKHNKNSALPELEWSSFGYYIL